MHFFFSVFSIPGWYFRTQNYLSLAWTSATLFCITCSRTIQWLRGLVNSAVTMLKNRGPMTLESGRPLSEISVLWKFQIINRFPQMKVFYSLYNRAINEWSLIYSRVKLQYTYINFWLMFNQIQILFSNIQAVTGQS